MVCERRWDSGEFGVTAVGVPAGVSGFGAEILLPADAELAVPTGVPQPRDADAIADRELVAGVLAHRGDLPDHLVARITPARCTGRVPSAPCRSVLHPPHACAASRSSPGPDCGTSQLPRSNA